MRLMIANGDAYLVYGRAIGRLRERLLLTGRHDIVETACDTLQLKLAHEDPTPYSTVQKILYIVAILGGISQVVSGLVSWNRVQFSGLVVLFGGFHPGVGHVGFTPEFGIWADHLQRRAPR